MANRPGGYSETSNATEETQKICDQVKSKVEEKTKKRYEEFTAIKFRSQVLTGANFLIKVHVGGSQYILLKVFLYSSGEIILLIVDVQEGHGKDRSIEPF